jgi:hypothetical protein
VAELRIGLRYTSVRLDDGHVGIAWTARTGSECCADAPEAGTLAGRPASELLNMLMSDEQPLYRTIGLATANALAASMPRPETTSTNVLNLIDVQETDHVAMVGFFAPLIERLGRTGCCLDIVELRKDRPDTLSPEEGRSSLAACSVGIVTATSLVTGTMDELISGFGDPRAVVILGPSSFMRPEAFSSTPVTHIAGLWVRDAAAVEKVVSEAGGTGDLKPYTDFETICLG